MIKKRAATFLMILTIAGCQTKDHLPDPVPDKPATDDARTILLKDIEALPLPSPYFHFEYDALHYVNKISFASNLVVYDVAYENKRVKKMTKESGHDFLVYTYDNNGQASNIDEFSGATGKASFTYRFLYDSGKQLAHVFWYKHLESGDPMLTKRADLRYYADGNLLSQDLFYASSPGQLDWSSREEFSDYDNKTNVDDIGLLNDFFGSYLFLPQVKLQKNNALKEHITSSQNEFFISNSFDYQNDLPVTKYSLVNQTKGLNPPPPTQVTSHFSYY